METPGFSTVRHSDLHTIARVAYLYYTESLNQQEIAEQLHLSRITVGRMLQRAREEGIVQIKINTPDNVFFDIERQLIQQYGLKDAIVTMEAEAGDPLYRTLAEATANWLLSHVWKGARIGLGMGRTISHIPSVFKPERPLECTFSEVTGGASMASKGVTQYNIVSKMAELAGGRAEYIYAPIIVSNKDACQALMNEAPVREALERARQCDIMIQGIGPVDYTALLYIHDYLNQQELESLLAQGGVGDLLGRYFDQYGESIESPLDQRIIGLTLDDIARIPWSVVVAGGAEKVPALRAVINKHLINILITDVSTAKHLLKEPTRQFKNNPPSSLKESRL
jgi:deoxyribonucleoside regulator